MSLVIFMPTDMGQCRYRIVKIFRAIFNSCPVFVFPRPFQRIIVICRIPIGLS